MLQTYGFLRRSEKCVFYIHSDSSLLGCLGKHNLMGGEGSVSALLSALGKDLCGAVQGEANMEREQLFPATLDSCLQKYWFSSVLEATVSASVMVTKRSLQSSGPSHLSAT